MNSTTRKRIRKERRDENEEINERGKKRQTLVYHT
jgi:hypothetical protein